MPHSTATPFVLSSLLEKKSNIKVAGGRRLLKEERGGGVKEVKTKILSLGGLFPCPSGPNMFKEGVKRVSASLLALELWQQPTCLQLFPSQRRPHTSKYKSVRVNVTSKGFELFDLWSPTTTESK